MTDATPRDAAPHDVARVAVVAATMADLEGTDDLPLAEQTARLAEAQRVLSGILSNDPAALQRPLPGPPGEA